MPSAVMKRAHSPTHPRFREAAWFPRAQPRAASPFPGVVTVSHRSTCYHEACNTGWQAGPNSLSIRNLATHIAESICSNCACEGREGTGQTNLENATAGNARGPGVRTGRLRSSPAQERCRRPRPASGRRKKTRIPDSSVWFRCWPRRTGPWSVEHSTRRNAAPAFCRQSQ